MDNHDAYSANSDPADRRKSAKALSKGPGTFGLRPVRPSCPMLMTIAGARSCSSRRITSVLNREGQTIPQQTPPATREQAINLPADSLRLRL